jgi:hypothetical protein
VIEVVVLAALTTTLKPGSAAVAGDGTAISATRMLNTVILLIMLVFLQFEDDVRAGPQETGR